MNVPAVASVAPEAIHVDLGMVEIEQILPHRGGALVIHKVHIHESTRASGYFSVCADDTRIQDHFGIMPGVLIAEFVHLTGAVLMMFTDREVFPILNTSTIEVALPAMPGDGLTCEVELIDQTKRRFTFRGEVFNQYGKSVATVHFTGTRFPRRMLERIKINQTSL